jgi:hypothetical protein
MSKYDVLLGELRQRDFTPQQANQLNTLVNNEYKVTYFTAISAASGTITIPSGATIMLDQFPNGVDAYVSQVDVNGQPTGLLPKTGLGVDVVITSFDALGNYTLSDTPSSFPVALIYVLKIKAIDYNNLVVDNILEDERIDDEDKLLTWSSSRSFTQGQKFIWQSPHGDYRTYIVRSGQTLNAGETPFTHPGKVERIDRGRIVTVDTIIQSGSAVITNPVFDIRFSDKKLMTCMVNTTALRIVQEDNIGNLSVLATLTASAAVWDVLFIPSINEFWALTLTTIERYDANTNTLIGSLPLTGIAPSSVYQLILDETRGYVYVLYLETTTRLIRFDISTLSIVGSVVNTGSNAARHGVLNEPTGYLYLSSTGTGTRIVDVVAWSTLSVVIFNIPNVGSVNKPFLLPNNQICYNYASGNSQIYELNTDPNIPTLVSTLRMSSRTIYGAYSPKTNYFYLFNRNGTNNNFQNRITVYDYFNNRILEETNPFIEQNGSVPFNGSELYMQMKFDNVNDCLWYSFSQNIAGVSGQIKTNI